ncbi:NfeD family protein [Candidatus Ozemobacteraceae bacterium]|nr:NfeD family protein [Candidatus Ozemobacteraceae bacterium]
MNWMSWLEILLVIVVLGKCFTMFVFPRILSRWLALNHKMTSEEGYVAVPDLSSLQGCEGIALTDLRPSGKADIDGRKLDVSVRQGIVKKGTRIRIVEVWAGNLYAKPVSDEGQPSARP